MTVRKSFTSTSRFVVDVALRWYHGGLGDLAASVTFWILLSLPATILALVAAVGRLDDILTANAAATVERTVVDFVNSVFTEEATFVKEAVENLFNQENSGLQIFTLLLAMWTISRGFAGLIRALDEVYEVEDTRRWYHTRVVALFLGLGSILIALPIVLLEIMVWTRVDGFVYESIVKPGLAVGILVVWASVIFYFGPAQRGMWRWDLPGATVAAVMWWALSYGFNFYVRFATGTNQVLGAIGAFLLALTWIWLAAQVLLIGAAVNSLLSDRLGLDRGKRGWNLNERIFKTGEMKAIKPGEERAEGGKLGRLKSTDSVERPVGEHGLTDDAVDFDLAKESTVL